MFSATAVQRAAIVTTMGVVVAVFTQTLGDLAYTYLNPRIRFN